MSTSLFIYLIIVIVLVVSAFLIIFLFIEYNEKFVPHNTREEPEFVSFTNHNLTKLPRVCNQSDPNYDLYLHKPYDWKVKNKECNKGCQNNARHPLSPFKIEPSKTDQVMGYDSMCLRDYKCMINYINPENDIRNIGDIRKVIQN